MGQQLPKIEESSKFNFITSIWIVPIVALIIAGWLAYQHYSERGPVIKIIFPQNEGLVAGQSVVKFRKVTVGKVIDIGIKEDLKQGVVVTVRMNKGSEPYLTEKAKFWIVKPEVGIRGVTGLDTLISGTYIDVYSEEGGTFREEHIGYTEPYRDSSNGEYFHLRSLDGANVSVGTPVYFKNIEVGQVAYNYLALDGKHIDIIVFVENQYVPFIHHDSKFWIKNMVNINYSKGNLDLSIAPVNYLLQGGIVFSSSGENKEKPVPEKYIFALYKSQSEAESKRVGRDSRTLRKFVFDTKESIARLKINSVVRYEEFDIGQVDDIELSYDKKTHQVLGKVHIEIDTSFFKDPQDPESSGEANLYQAVTEGLRVKLSSLDPLSRMLFVDLTFDHQDGFGSVTIDGDHLKLPIATNNEESIMESATSLVNRLNALPLDELLESVIKVVEKSNAPIENANALLVDLNTTVQNINALTSKKSFVELSDELSIALNELTRTLKSTQKVVKGYDSDSLVREQLTQTLEILTKTSQEMQTFLRMLNRKPNSLIFGDN